MWDEHISSALQTAISTKFHAGITTSSNNIRVNAYGAWDLVQQSKNCFWRHFICGMSMSLQHCKLSFLPNFMLVSQLAATILE